MFFSSFHLNQGRCTYSMLHEIPRSFYDEDLKCEYVDGGVFVLNDVP